MNAEVTIEKSMHSITTTIHICTIQLCFIRRAVVENTLYSRIKVIFNAYYYVLLYVK